MCFTVISSPAGTPSRMTTRALPWDSPAVRKRSTGPIYRGTGGRSKTVRRSAGDQTAAEQHRHHRAEGEERAERERTVAPAPDQHPDAVEGPAGEPDEHRPQHEGQGLGEG